MHEMSIAQGIIEIVDETLQNENGAKLQEVVIDIGELVAVVPESLEFCYSALVENTKYEGSQLVINILPLTGKCSACNNNFKIKDLQFVCPDCSQSDIEVSGGQELNIRYLEVE